MADVATFKSVFPEFTDWANIDTVAAFWLTQEQNQLALNMLGANADMASYLFVAHSLALNKPNADAAAVGMTPGAVAGPISSKSAGGLSVSYDLGSITTPGAGDWNATSYGIRLAALISRASKGRMIYAATPPRPHVYGSRPFIP